MLKVLEVHRIMKAKVTGPFRLTLSQHTKEETFSETKRQPVSNRYPEILPLDTVSSVCGTHCHHLSTMSRSEAGFLRGESFIGIRRVSVHRDGYKQNGYKPLVLQGRSQIQTAWAQAETSPRVRLLPNGPRWGCPHLPLKQRVLA